MYRWKCYLQRSKAGEFGAALSQAGGTTSPWERALLQVSLDCRRAGCCAEGREKAGWGLSVLFWHSCSSQGPDDTCVLCFRKEVMGSSVPINRFLMHVTAEGGGRRQVWPKEELTCLCWGKKVSDHVFFSIQGLKSSKNVNFAVECIKAGGSVPCSVSRVSSVFR